MKDPAICHMRVEADRPQPCGLPINLFLGLPTAYSVFFVRLPFVGLCQVILFSISVELLLSKTTCWARIPFQLVIVIPFPILLLLFYWTNGLDFLAYPCLFALSFGLYIAFGFVY